MSSVAEALNTLVDICHREAKNNGWWSKPDTSVQKQATCIALMHSELSEALEGIRKDKQDDQLPHRKSVEVELADTIIRVCDFAGAYGLDLGGALVEKLAFNSSRADHKKENRLKDGGKKF